MATFEDIASFSVLPIINLRDIGKPKNGLLFPLCSTCKKNLIKDNRCEQYYTALANLTLSEPKIVQCPSGFASIAFIVGHLKCAITGFVPYPRLGGDEERNQGKKYPELKLHALGPPEIVYLSKKERLSFNEVLKHLIEAGLDSLPGAGAEILSDRVRNFVSPAKATSEEWLGVMEEAHKLNLPTSATMMYGHVETIAERIEHLLLLRDLQAKKPEGNFGFITFIPWPFQDEGTVLLDRYGVSSKYNGPDYIRMIAISRIILNNIKNIQASILTVGKETGMLSLHSGANDLGSIMIEENVVSAAGANNRFDAGDMQSIIKQAGFIPGKRNQKYELTG